MKFSVDLLWRSWIFWFVVAAFALANLASAVLPRLDPACCDREISIGFPFPIHVSGGIAGVSDFYVFGLLLDLLLAWTIAVLVVWIVRLLRGPAS